MKRNMLIILSIVAVLFSLVLVRDSSLLSAEKDSVKKGYLGVSIEPLSRQLKKELKAEFGVVITNIEEDSPSDKDGLMEDDVIQQVNDVKIRRTSTLTRIIRKMKPGDTAAIIVIRDGKEKAIKVTIGKYKESSSFSINLGRGANIFRHFGGKAYLGVQLHELNEGLAEYFSVKPDAGVLVLEVEDDSPAEKSGIKAGDIIAKVDNETVSHPEDIQEILAELEEDDEIEIELIQKGKKKTVKVMLEESENLKSFYFSPSQNIHHFETIPRLQYELKKFESKTKRDKELPGKKIEIKEKSVISTETI
ncbi:MAG TPA: PDZ domain-containing protein [bacterium]